MKRNAFDENRDKRIAAEADDDRKLMCPAKGCPRKWSVMGDRGKACSAHYWAEPADWPRITADLQRDEVNRARERDWQSQLPPPPPMGREQRLAIGADIAKIGHGGVGDPKAWAYRLLERHRNGERLTQFQVAAYTAALPYSVVHPDEEAPR